MSLDRFSIEPVSACGGGTEGFMDGQDTVQRLPDFDKEGEDIWAWDFVKHFFMGFFCWVTGGAGVKGSFFMKDEVNAFQLHFFKLLTLCQKSIDVVAVSGLVGVWLVPDFLLQFTPFTPFFCFHVLSGTDSSCVFI